MPDMKKTIKPLCLCVKCGADVVPTKTEAGRFLMQFRKTPYDPATQRAYGMLGGRPKKTIKNEKKIWIWIQSCRNYLF